MGAKSLLSVVAILLLVKFSYQQKEGVPSLYALSPSPQLCVNYTGDATATGTLNPNQPCELICLTSEGTRRTIYKKDGEDCSASETLPNICYKGKCTAQVSSKDGDKGFPCTSAGTGYRAIQKSASAQCTLVCIPAATDTSNKAFDSPARQGSLCLRGRNVGACRGTVCAAS